MTKAELKRIAKQVIETNLAVWQAIHLVEEFYNDRISEIGEKDMKKLAEIMTSLEDGDDAMADPEKCGLYFQNFEEFGMKLNKYLDI